MHKFFHHLSNKFFHPPTSTSAQNQTLGQGVQPSDEMLLPLPPIEFRHLVGPIDNRFYENPDGRLVWGELAYGPLSPGQAYQRVFDFGCGCGRLARKLLLQHTPPEHYIGVDINRPMIEWCQQNLSKPQVKFFHHDVWAQTLAPENSQNRMLPIRHYGSDFSLIIANSVFTHLLEDQTRFYLAEMLAMLADHGLLYTSWFFFNRAWFPVLASFQHCLYVNPIDPTHAVYYDWDFFLEMIRELGFKIVDVIWTWEYGFQNIVILGRGENFEDISPTIEPPGTVLGFGASKVSPQKVEAIPGDHSGKIGHDLPSEWIPGVTC